MAANLFDKVKQSLDTGLTTVSAKSKETVEVVKLRGQIKDLQLNRREALEGLGTMVYAMYSNGNFLQDRIDDKCKAIDAIDQEITAKENEIAAIQARTQSAIEATKSDMACPNCNTLIPKDSKFCTKCGSKIEAGPHCQCGKLLAPDAKFCTNCGRKLESQTSTKLECSQCGKTLDQGSKFCVYCGTKQTAE